MELPVNVVQATACHMRIDFGRADAGVTEQFLDDPQVRAVFE